MNVCIYFDPHDAWVGLYWKRGHTGRRDYNKWVDHVWTEWHAYICLLPMLVFHLRWRRWTWDNRADAAIYEGQHFIVRKSTVLGKYVVLGAVCQWLPSDGVARVGDKAASGVGADWLYDTPGEAIHAGEARERMLIAAGE